MLAEENKTDENDTNMKRAKEAIEKYYFQVTEGCGRESCSNPNCASNPSFRKLTNNQAAVVAVRLAKEKATLCELTSNKKQQSDSNKQQQSNDNSTKRAATATDMNEAAAAATTNRDEDFDDDEDVVVSNSSSTLNLRAGSSNSNRGAAAAATASAKSDLKSMNEALQEAVKFVTEINDNPQDEKRNKKPLYLSENRVLNLIKKCKANLSELRNCEKMDVDTAAVDSSSLPHHQHHQTAEEEVHCYKPLLSVLQSVFQSYKSLSLSFTLKSDSSSSAGSASDFAAAAASDSSSLLNNIDFASLRRSYNLLFKSLTNNELVMNELEKSLDLSVYTLCISIRMMLKKSNLADQPDDLRRILHSILIINELPLLEDPKFMDRCAKIFYATLTELPVSGSVQIVKLWSSWPSDELRACVNKVQQYITVCTISKSMQEENSANHADDDEDNEEETSEKLCLHKSEGIAGAVGCLRLIYYACILGGRLDPESQIGRERQLEVDEIAHFEDTLALEEQDYFSDNLNLSTYMMDPLERELSLRPIDCREPKIPLDQFVNEVANKYIDIQHDYVEYTKHLQNLEFLSHETSRPSSSSAAAAAANNKFRKPIFSFLANPFFIVLAKKNLGLYYDNKIKMMRERRNHIMMSLLEGRMPTPYFKIRLTRQNLLSEALNLIELQEQENPATLRKQLFVEFENEQGIDQGGVSKEFFQLAIDELLNKGYTFFTYDEKSKYYWFTPATLETPKEFRVVGILFGIAIYNSVLLDVQFPPIFFRKLMGKLATLEDLFYSHHDTYKSFMSILEFDGTDEEFEETFMITFQISIKDNFDTVVNFNLKENGDKIPVTKQNRKEFVDLYADFILNKGIEESFKAFRRGFLKIVMNSPLIRWYTPEELEILLCGTKVMDWKSLENSTSYDSGFDVGHQFIKDFWSVFEEFTDEEKKLFLKFTTGTDRCPHGGLSELKLTIARNGPDTEKYL